MTRDLPEGWEWAKLDDVTDVKGGLAKGKRRDPSTPVREVPYLRVANVQRGAIDLSEVKTILATEDEISAMALLPGDILFNEGGDRDKLGRGWIWEGQISTCIHQNHVFRARPLHRSISPRFVSYYGNSAGQSYFLDNGAQSVNLASISKSKLCSLPIPLPPAAEQRRIVDKIEALTARSRNAREALAAVPGLIERYRQSLLAAAFRGDLTAEWREAHPHASAESALHGIAVARSAIPTTGREGRNTEDPSRPAVSLGDLPETWRVVRLDSLTDPSRKIQYGILMPGPDIANGVPYVKVVNMRGDKVDVASLKRTSKDIHQQYERAALRAGDLLLSIRGTYGRVAEVPEALEGANITQDTVRIAPMPGIHRVYLALYLRSPSVQKYFDQIAKGVAVRGINVGDVRPMEVAFPPFAEQAAIVSAVQKSLDTVTDLLVRATAMAANIATLDSAILAKAFRGELVPQDPNDEPASVLLDRIRAERATGGKPRRGRRKMEDA